MKLRYEVHNLVNFFVLQVKIAGNNKDMLERACQVFLKKNTSQIQDVCKETLEGHQRAIMGNVSKSCQKV